MPRFFDPPEGFQLSTPEMPTFDPPQGFQVVGLSDAPTTQISTPAQQPEMPAPQTRQAEAPEQQEAPERSVLDRFNPISSAEARGIYVPKNPNSWPATPEEFEQKYHRPPTSEERKYFDGTTDRSTYTERRGRPSTDPDAPPRPTAPKQAPSEWQQDLWRQMEGVKTPPPPKKEGWNRLTDPQQGVFPFNYPSTYRGMVHEDVDRMQRGWGEVRGGAGDPKDYYGGRVGEVAAGVGRMGLGALGYAVDPVSAGVRSIAGQPIENVTGIPKEYTEFAGQLAIPGLGLPKVPGAGMRGIKETGRVPWPTQPQARSMHNVLSREAVDPVVPRPAASPAEGLKQTLADMKQEPKVPGYTAGGARDKAAAAGQGAEKIFSPETVGPSAEDAVSFLREYGGEGARRQAIAQRQLDDVYKTVEKANPQQKDALADFIDGGKSARPPGALGDAADTIRNSLKATTEEFKKLPENVQKAFRDEYFPHMWKNWSTGPRAGGPQGGGPQGVKPRSEIVQTYGEGRALGLEPRFENPIDGVMYRIGQMERAVTGSKTLESAMDAGTVVKAEGMEAKALIDKLGYAGLDSRPGHYAPENFARIWNNYFSPGIHARPEFGKAYDMARNYSNFTTQALLGLSGYHAYTMAEASWGTQLARAFKSMGHGDVVKGAKELGMAPFAPVSYLATGHQAQKMYLGLSRGSKADTEAIDWLTKANWRPVGIEHTADIMQSRLGTFTKSLQRGTLAREYKDLTAGKVLGLVGRTMDTINEPLFKQGIPRLKAGANFNRAKDWLAANPGAGATEKMAAMRKIVDETDNSFGEMVQDNIFWNKMLKQSAMLGMLSYSWNMGGARQWGGGMRDIARMATGGEFTPKAAYVLSSGMLWGMLNTMQQKLHTGQSPWESDTPLQDMMAFRTGGTTQVWRPEYTDSQGVKHKPAYETVTERGRVPGYMKDIIAYYSHPLEEFGHKLGPGFRQGYELGITGKDWKGDPIWSPRMERDMANQAPTWFGNTIQHIVDTTYPISLQNMGFGGKPQNPDTGLNKFEQLSGMTTAQSVLQNPYAEATKQHFGQKGWNSKVRREKARETRMENLRQKHEQPEYGGPQ